MQGLILQTWPGVWMFGVLCFVALALWLWLDSAWDKLHGLAVVSLLGVVLCVWAWFFASTHAVVPVDTVGVVLNTATGQVDGDVRVSGVVDVPLVGATVLLFPAMPNDQWCDEYHPAASGGIAIKIDPCWVIDASAINWKQQLIRTGKTTAGDILNQLHNPLSDVVASTVRGSTIEQLGDQALVAANLDKAAGSVFAGFGIPLKSVSIQNWDFENPEVGKLYDQAAVSQTGKLKAEADQQAALAEKQAAMTRAQTANDVLVLQTDALNKSLTTLGVDDPESRANVLQLRMLLEFLNTHPQVTLIVNANGTLSASGSQVVSLKFANPQTVQAATLQPTVNNK